MADPSAALRKQVERLRDALTKDGEEKQAASLTGILKAAERLKEITPSRIERSRAYLSGETLGRNTPVPRPFPCCQCCQKPCRPRGPTPELGWPETDFRGLDGRLQSARISQRSLRVAHQLNKSCVTRCA